MIDASIFSSDYCEERPETLLWLAVINKAMEDRFHSNKLVREDAEAFFFNSEDDRLMNLLGPILGFGAEEGIRTAIAKQLRITHEVKEVRHHACVDAFSYGIGDGDDLLAEQSDRITQLYLESDADEIGTGPDDR